MTTECMEPTCHELATHAHTTVMPGIDVPLPVKACAAHQYPLAFLSASFGGSSTDFRPLLPVVESCPPVPTEEN